MTIQAVLFDFGGVLADSPFDAFTRYEAAHGLPDGFIRSLNASNPDDNAWARLERNELDFAGFCAAFEAEARAWGGEVDAAELFTGISGALRPAMVDVVRRCRPALRTGLLTNNFVTSVPRPAHAELLDLFDVVVESSVVGVRKPDPRFYLLACEALSIEPAEAVFLDDLGVNLKAARQLGIVTIKVTQDVTAAITALESVTGIALR